MEENVRELLKFVRPGDDHLRDQIIAIANKASKRSKNLLIDILEMESMIDPEKVEPSKGLGKVEVDL